MAKTQKLAAAAAAGWLFGSIFRFLRRFVFLILSAGVIPKHIAFILDGNRRYAKKHKLLNETGYRAGFLALICLLKYCHELGINYVSLFIFSIDNFSRTAEEVQFLMDLMSTKVEGLLKYQDVLNQYGVRVQFIGNLNLIDRRLRVAAEAAMHATCANSNIVLIVCLAYASSAEIVRAAQQCCMAKREELMQVNSLEVAPAGIVTVADMETNMYTAGLGPDPDIVVRTAGANRLSNFLMWQTSNTMLYSTGALFPEIGLRHLVWAVLTFQRAHPYLQKRVILS